MRLGGGCVTEVELPLIDVSGFLAGGPAGTERAAAELRDVLQQVGFFRIVGHRVV